MIAISVNSDILDAICSKQKDIFKETVWLFPPGFPKKDDKQHDLLSNIEILKTDYEETFLKAN